MLIAAVLMCGSAIAEAVFRGIDGYRLDAIALRRVREPRIPVGEDTPDLQYAMKVPRPPSVSMAWYVERPQPIPKIPMTAELRKRADSYPSEPWSPFFEWNLQYLKDLACHDGSDVVMGGLRDFYYFESADGTRFPTYRHLPHISPPGWFVTNSFGWRGPDIAVNKPANTIRIAFVGASTTVDAFGMPFSHPELVGDWLNRWSVTKGLPYRFEVINAGRMGIDSNSIAAIVAQEIVPVDADLVIYYEGANQLWPDRLVTIEDGRRPRRQRLLSGNTPRPQTTPRWCFGRSRLPIACPHAMAASRRNRRLGSTGRPT